LDARSGINWSCSSLARYDSSFLMTMLVRVNRVSDLSWLRDEVAELCCLDDNWTLERGPAVVSADLA
jgi:hypothetical protein